MNEKYQRQSVHEDRRYRRGWKRITVVLSLVVVIATISFLMLPAITMNREDCGIEEHQHTEDCFTLGVEYSLQCNAQTLGIHQHDRSCYDKTERLICGLADYVVHQHDAACLDADGALVCTLPEAEEHIHDSNCWGLEEAAAGHAHGDDCYAWNAGTTLLCGQTALEDHAAHTADCYETEKLLCEIHIHSQGCYAPERGDLICGEEERAAAEPGNVLTCEKSEALAHQHGEGCFGGTAPVLICQLPEHVHSDACLADGDGSSEPAVPSAEGGFTFAADDYVTSIIAIDGTELPEDTVVTADPLFDSNEPAVATFALVAEESDENTDDTSAYVDEILKAVTWGEVTRIKLFDISLSSGGGKVQPSAPVEVRTEFAEPLAAESGIVVYGVHFGESGPEILPATAQRDENGNILSVSHTQNSFSTTGYILVHVDNPMDIGPDILPVHYCIWVNDQWIIAGSSRTGWYGSYDPRGEWPPAQTEDRDFITLDQMGHVLGKYGLDISDHEQIEKTIWYQRAEDDGKTIRHDTKPMQKEINGEQKWIFPLSGNKVKDDGYHVYFVPNGTNSGKENDPQSTYDRNRLLGEDLKQESKFYTMTVRDMNHIVYGVDEALPETQILLYNTPVSVTVKQNANNGWQWVNDKGKVVHGKNGIYDANGDGNFEQSEYDTRFRFEENEDGTETYFFGSEENNTGILGRTTLIPYSTAADGAEQSTDKQVDIVVHLDGEWQKVGQLNLMYKQDGVCVKNGEPLWYITAGQVYTILKDFGFTDPVGGNDITKDGYTFCHAVGAFDENTDPASVMLLADGVTQKLIKPASGNEPDPEDESSKTIAIGLGPHNADHFTLFYLPGSSDEKQEDIQGAEGQSKTAKEYAEDADLIAGDRFYSLRIVDDYQLVYYGHETDAFMVYVPEGDPVKVSVQNALSVLWSVHEPWKTDRPESYIESPYTVDNAGNFNVYEFSEVNGPIRIDATSLNPTFYVQYFANIERYQLYDTAETGTLALIDTSGGKLPANTETPDLKYLKLTKTDAEGNNLGNTDQNAGVATPLYRVETYIDNAEIYRQVEYSYDRSHLWQNIDKLYDNDSYKIENVWILKEGMDPLSTDEEDWWIYESENNGANITFTNLASEEYAPKDENNNVQSGEDYKILITQGMVMRLHYLLEVDTSTNPGVTFYDYDVSSDGSSRVTQGINSAHSGHINVTNYSGYAFGNNNTSTGTGDYQWTDPNGKTVNLNKTNKNNDVYSGCAFGLVTGRNEDGRLVWANGITAPNIFYGATPTGRTDHTGSLTFNKRGDVYTLSASSVGSGSRDDLHYFFNPSPSGATIYDHIFTNDFWAMDGITGKDGLGGGVIRNFLPASDDGKDHNSYFGMNFAIEFSVSEDYIGPMEYIFFGDDDMWVFLDGKLVCDIGGVHSAVGEYVNLRDYLPAGEEGTAGRHKLEFYYVERGASGSTCWMSFTLPSVTYTTVTEGISQISISKALQSLDGEPIGSDERYEFVVELFTNEKKEVPVDTPFSVQVDRADGTTDYFSTSSGRSLRLAANDNATILGVPIGTWYVISEKEDDRFFVRANGAEGRVVEGETEEVNLATFVNIRKGYALPDTGGVTHFPYILSGWALMAVASVLMYRIHRKKRKEGE